MIQKPAANLDLGIWESLVAPNEGTFSVAVAKEILAIKFRDDQKAEIEKLLDRNNAGTISVRQKEKLEAYVRIGNWLGLLQAKARASLAKKPSRR